MRSRQKVSFANTPLHGHDGVTMTDPQTRVERWIIAVGSLGPLGRLSASGTITVALVGLPLFWAMSRLSTPIYLGIVVVFTLVSVAIHQAGDRILNQKDSSRLVWDELAGFMIAVALVPFSWHTAAIAFFVERALDIAKVPPARWIERRWPGGWGVVGDDVIAGLYTCGALHLLCRIAPKLLDA